MGKRTPTAATKTGTMVPAKPVAPQGIHDIDKRPCAPLFATTDYGSGQFKNTTSYLQRFAARSTRSLEFHSLTMCFCSCSSFAITCQQHDDDDVHDVDFDCGAGSGEYGDSIVVEVVVVGSGANGVLHWRRQWCCSCRTC
jgi:hypothetical protein